MFKFAKTLTLLLILFITTLFIAKDALAEGVLDGAYYVTGSAQQGQDTLSFKYLINNPGAAIQSGPIRASIRSNDGKVTIPCNTTFDHDASDGTSSFNKEVTAECDLSSRTSGTYYLVLQEGAFNRIDIQSVDYTFGQPAPYTGTLSQKRLANGDFEFTIYAGTQPFALETEANIFIEGNNLVTLTAPWNGGTNYSCTPAHTKLNRASPTQTKVTCSILNIPSGTYSVHLLRGRSFEPDKLIGNGTTITIGDIEITRITRAVSGENQNIFDVTVVKYSGGTKRYNLKVEGSDIPTYPRDISTGTYTFSNLNFNMLTPGQWPAYLVEEGSGTIYRQPEDVIPVTGGGLNNSCSCQILSAGPSCGPDPLWRVTNNCSVGATAKPVCINPDITQGLLVPTCECACSSPTITAPGVPGAIITEFDADDLSSFFKLMQNVIIAIAVIAGVFIIPYAFVLMASGNPEKIKEGTDWLKSIFWGYLVVFLAGALIRFVGSEILSLGF